MNIEKINSIMSRVTYGIVKVTTNTESSCIYEVISNTGEKLTMKKKLQISQDEQIGSLIEKLIAGTREIS
jgi:hypothetical protein